MTTFSELNLERIQRKATELMIPKIGYNRNMSQVIFYEPAKIGGISLYYLYGEQGWMQITQFIKFSRYRGKMINF